MTWPSGTPFYKCMEPGCPHYLPTAILAVNRESLCWGPHCNNLVTITLEDVNRKLKKPMCDRCKKERLERRKEMEKIV